MIPLLADIIEQQYSELELGRMPSGWAQFLALVAVAGVIYLVIWLYRREARAGASLRLRMSLAALRCAALLLLVVIWVDPVIATYTIRKLTASVIVLTDVSESMAIGDAAGGRGEPMRRIDRVAGLLTGEQHEWLRRLEKRNALLWYTFGDEPQRRALPWGEAQQGAGNREEGAVAEQADRSQAPAAGALAATDLHTDLGAALNRAMREAGEGPIAAVVVISDGAVNTGMSPEGLAAYLRRFDAPLHAVAVGAPHEPPNVRVADFRVPATAAVGDPVELRADVSANHVEGAALRLELVVRDLSDGASGSDEPRVVESREITLGGEQPERSEVFTLNPEQAGEYVYSVRVGAIEGEPVLADNEREAVMRVLDEKLRVLLVSGRPSFDYRHVTHLLERDASIDLSCWLQTADPQALRDGDTPLTELPRTIEALLEYDVVLLMDPEPTELDSAWAIAVRRLVDEFGGGLLLQAGTHYSSRFLRDPRLEELITLLPVSADPDADVRLSSQGAYRTQAAGFVVPDDAWNHPALRLHDDAVENRQVWEALPGVWWFLPVLREKPLASVLLRHASASQSTPHGKSVLLAAQPFGAGRTAFLAFDTWRWRGTAETYYNRFWIQLVRYLGQSRREGASKRGRIVLDRDAINLGDFVKVEVRVLAPNFAPWHEPQIEAEIIGGDAPLPLKLDAIPGRPGWFSGRFAADWAGQTTIRVPLPGGSGGGAPAGDRGEGSGGGAGAAGDAPGGGAGRAPETELVKHLHVFRPNVEMQSLRAHEETLRQLAEGSGGRFVPIAEAGTLPELIPNATRETAPTRDVDQRLWDNTWLLSLIALLLAVEWTIRRRNHLL